MSACYDLQRSKWVQRSQRRQPIRSPIWRCCWWTPKTKRVVSRLTRSMISQTVKKPTYQSISCVSASQLETLMTNPFLVFTPRDDRNITILYSHKYKTAQIKLPSASTDTFVLCEASPSETVRAHLGGAAAHASVAWWPLTRRLQGN